MNQKVQRKGAKTNAAGRRAEEWFESYLADQRIAYKREPRITGKSRRIDYRIALSKDRFLWCEVKSLLARHSLPTEGVGSYFSDPYTPIREEIDEARIKFKEYKDELCGLVLKKDGPWDLGEDEEPRAIFAAMLGDVVMTIPIGPNVPKQDRKWSAAFDVNGKMLRPGSGMPQNTTISAIVLIGDYRIRNPEFDRELARRRVREGVADAKMGSPNHSRKLAIRWELSREIPCILGHTKRARVFENPFARHPLPTEIFSSKFDERFRFRLEGSWGRIERVNAVQAPAVVADRVQHATIAEQVEHFCDEVVRQYSPRKIILFGSHSQGVVHADSDVDLLVVMPGNDDQFHLALDIRRRLGPQFALDLLVRSEGELKRRIENEDWFLREIVDTGKVLYEAAHARVG